MKTICLLLSMALPLVVRGQATESKIEPLFENAAGVFFALSVADVQASARWYSEKLGLKS